MNQDWEWKYGQTPEFQQVLQTKFHWGEVKLQITAKRAEVTHVEVKSDDKDATHLLRSLVGVAYDPSALGNALTHASNGSSAREIAQWLAKEIRN